MDIQILKFRNFMKIEIFEKKIEILKSYENLEFF
jgi:hypothetical protein